MRREPEAFDGIEPVLVYVAKKLAHATEVERLLTDAAIDYVLETDAFASGWILRTERMGVFFYVAPDHETQARQVLSDHGFVLAVQAGGS